MSASRDGGDGGRGPAELGDAAEQALRHLRALAEDAGALRDTLSSMASIVEERVDLDRRMRETPARTLLIAAGIGYVAGGGLFTPTTGTLLRLGTRFWLMPALRKRFTSTPPTSHREEELH
jgi:hypothetical protein